MDSMKRLRDQSEHPAVFFCDNSKLMRNPILRREMAIQGIKPIFPDPWQPSLCRSRRVSRIRRGDK
ncbi:hypothetical protein [Desulfobacter vibrioformis]|uniref:hypothetical protein n=1 Tax=Desulfobacter vibrioformis TaxID=34031 RepID=UPI000554DC7F|nr:hypothetical protein [Desulfobacter vibrioformis]